MLPVIPKPPISRKRKRVALAVAGAVDLLQIVVLPAFVEGALSPFQDALDVMAAIALTAICGFKWQFVVAFGLELVPVAALFPTWAAMVLTLPAADPSGRAEVQVSASVPAAQGTAGGTGGPGTVDVQGVIAPPVQRKSLADR
jgi:hypothetical protein